jgi:hypothetical protein
MSHHPPEDDDKEGRDWDVQFSARLQADLTAAQRKLVVWRRIAGIMTVVFFADCAAVVPFLSGHPLHSDWEQVGKYLVMIAMALLVIWAFACGTAFNFWYYIRGTKRIQQM